MWKIVALVALVAIVGQSSGQAVELTQSNFDDLVINSGKNAFVKFQAPWCGHCKAMKAAWDQLGGEYEGSSVVIGDSDCTGSGKELCERFEVRGYPTIKYFTGETGPKGEAYNGGRDLNGLKKFVVDTLEVKCNVDEPSGCDEKELSFLETVKSKAGIFIQEQLERLNKMKEGKMGSAARAWLNKRVNVLTQLFKKNEGKEDL